MKKLLFSGLFVSLGLLLGRISGFLREAIIASNYGASELTDLIIVFLSAPDLLVSLLVGGALGMALIPEFNKSSVYEAKIFYQQSICLIFLLFSVISFFLALYANVLIGFLAPGLSGGLSVTTLSLFSMTLIAVPIAAATGVSTAFLHYKGGFLLPSLGTLIFNSVVIVGLVCGFYFKHFPSLLVVSITIVLASLIRWLSQLAGAKVLPFSFSMFRQLLLTCSLLRRYCYAVLTGGVIFVLPVMVKALASNVGEGELSLVNYALKLVDLPLGVVLTVFSIVFFPKLALDYANDSTLSFEITLCRVLLAVIAVSIAIFVPLFEFSRLVVDFVYNWGGLDSYALAKIDRFFSIAIFTLPLQGVSMLLITAFSARQDTLTPLLISSACISGFALYAYSGQRGVEDLLYATIGVYVALNCGLVFMLTTKHSTCFFIKPTFATNFIKLAMVGGAYYTIITLGVIKLDKIVELLIFGPIMVISCMFVCLVVSKEIRMLIGKGLS